VSVAAERRLPPVYPLAISSMVLVLIGGIYVAAYMPNVPTMALPVALSALSAVLLLANLVMLSRTKPFAWRPFFQVGLWSLLVYVVIAGMLELIFVLDGTPGSILGLLTLQLAIFAVDVPLLFAFSVARYQ